MPIADTNGCKVLHVHLFLFSVTTVTNIRTVSMYYVLPYCSTKVADHGRHACSSLLIGHIAPYPPKRWRHDRGRTNVGAVKQEKTSLLKKKNKTQD